MNRNRITAQPDPSIASLTPRQLDVAQLLAIGRSNAEIGQQLGMSENTVKKHLEDVFATLGVTNRTECAVRMRHDAPRNAIPLRVTHVDGVAVTRTSELKLTHRRDTAVSHARAPSGGSANESPRS